MDHREKTLLRRRTWGCKTHDIELALKFYLRGSVPHKVVECFVELGQFDKIIIYSKKVNYQPDYLFLMRQVLRTRPGMASKFAQMLVSDYPEPLADIDQV